MYYALMIYFIAILSGVLAVTGLLIGSDTLIYVSGVFTFGLLAYLLLANAFIKLFTGEYANDHEIELVSRELIKRAIRKK